MYAIHKNAFFFLKQVHKYPVINLSLICPGIFNDYPIFKEITLFRKQLHIIFSRCKMCQIFNHNKFYDENIAIQNNSLSDSLIVKNDSRIDIYPFLPESLRYLVEDILYWSLKHIVEIMLYANKFKFEENHDYFNQILFFNAKK